MAASTILACDQGRSVGKIKFAQNRKMVRISFSEKVGTAEKILKSKTHNGAFWPYLKRRFGSSNWGETFEIKNDNRCILTELLRKCWNQGRLNSPFWRYLKQYFWSWNCWCILMLFIQCFRKLEMLRNLLKQDRLI